MRSRNPLYVMAKPPPEAQAQIAALPRNDPSRGPDLLHVTLLSLFDLHYAPPEWLPQVIAALDSFVWPAFPLAFDRIENRKAVTLRTRARLAEARAFQAGLVRHFLERKVPMMLGTTPEPHVTINYRGDRLGSQKMPAIGWTVGEIILMESVVGKTSHVEHGRWRLRAGDLP
jgi:2'-5' RNA ligase